MSAFSVRFLLGLAAVVVGSLALSFVALASMFAEFRNFDLIAAWSMGGEFLIVALGFYAAVVFGAGLVYLGVGMMKRKHG